MKITGTPGGPGKRQIRKMVDESFKKIDESFKVADLLCTPSEYHILHNIMYTLESGSELSPRQINSLERIYKKACDSPF